MAMSKLTMPARTKASGIAAPAEEAMKPIPVMTPAAGAIWVRPWKIEPQSPTASRRSAGSGPDVLPSTVVKPLDIASSSLVCLPRLEQVAVFLDLPIGDVAQEPLPHIPEQRYVDVRELLAQRLGQHAVLLECLGGVDHRRGEQRVLRVFEQVAAPGLAGLRACEPVLDVQAFRARHDAEHGRAVVETPRHTSRRPGAGGEALVCRHSGRRDRCHPGRVLEYTRHVVAPDVGES